MASRTVFSRCGGVQAQVLADLFSHAHDRVQGSHRVLENHGHIPAPDAAQGLFRKCSHIDAVESHLRAPDDMSPRRQEADQGAAEHRFAAPGLAHDTEGPTGREGKRHTVHRAHQAFSGIDPDAQVRHREKGCGRIRCVQCSHLVFFIATGSIRAGYRPVH